jgi:HEAT repeat protein
VASGAGRIRSAGGLLWVAVGVCAALAARSGEARELNLYDWIFPAPVVVSGRALDSAGGETAVVVERVLRGTGLEPSDVIQLLIRRANRERDESDSVLRLEAGRSYLFLLEEAADPRSSKEPRAVYELVRGVEGARPVPAERAVPFLDAAERLARIQDQDDDALMWRAFEEMLEETDVLLVSTAVEEFVKFERGGPELIPLLRPLLAHPRPELRERVLELTGRILQRHGQQAMADAPALEGEIVALARRDSAAGVRVAATRALGGLGGPAVTHILEEISRDDPEQAVRYAAERLLYERGGTDAARGSGARPN